MDDLSSIGPALFAGQTVNTWLTSDCNAQTEATFDLNDTTWVTFYYQNKVPLWQALLSVANQKVTLSQTIQACGVTLSEGLQVTFNAMRGTYTVLLTGNIIEADKTYKFVGTLLGSFTRSTDMKRAVKFIRMGRTGLIMPVGQRSRRVGPPPPGPGNTAFD